MAQIVEVPGMGDVEFPDDMTDAQITAVIQKNRMAKPVQAAPQEAPITRAPTFAETGGGAVTGIQMQPRTLSPLTPLGRATMAVGGAGGMGATMGTFAPELLTGGAATLRSFPQGARVAPLLESAAIAAKAAGRPATALAGGVSGLASETAGQAAEAAGAGPVTAEAIRFGAGALTPESLPVAKLLLDVMKKKIPASFEAAFTKNLALKVASYIEGRPQDISAKEAELLNKLVGELRGGAASEEPMKKLYGTLQAGAKSKLALGETEARVIMENSDRAIQQELNIAERTGAKAEDVSKRITTRGQEALAVAKQQRLNIGNDVDPTDIGTNLRTVIVGRNQAAIEARRAEYSAAEKARDAIVQQKESAGVHIDAMPEYTQLVQLLSAEAKPGIRSPDVASNLNHILKQVTTAEAEGVKPPVSFQQLDDVRRQLGEVFRGKPPEGYAAIDAAAARKYYGMISDIQKKYAGPPQETLLNQYAEATQGLEMFSSKAGRRATAVDRYDDTKFQTDAAALPRQFFATRQGVSDLIELTGSRTAAVQAGLDLATTELNNLSERQVREWMTKRREMLSALPEVRDKVLAYANNLQHGENTALAAERGIGRVTAIQEQRQRMTQQRTSQIGREAETRAADITAQRAQEVVSLLGPRGQMFEVGRVKALLESGTSEQWALAAPMIKASPGGKEMLVESIRQTMGDKAMESIKGLSSFFNSNIRPAMTATRLMSPEQMDQIAGQLAAIEKMKVTEPEKLGLARRVVLQAFAGYAASGAARGATSLADLVPGAPYGNPQPMGILGR